MLNSLPINPIQFIQTAGVSGFVSGVQTGMIAPAQAITGFRAVGQAIDTYAEVRPITSLADLRTSIGGLPERKIESKAQEVILGLLTTHHADVERAVRFAVKASEVGAAVAAGLEAPFDLGAEWGWIFAEDFQIGSARNDQHRYDDEKFLETVMTGGFFMLDHPVTNAEFRVFLEAIGREDLRDLDREFAGDRQPAVRVTHDEATVCSRWLGEEIAQRMGVSVIGRLPTEAEWEKAANGPDGNEFVISAISEQVHLYAGVTCEVDHPGVYANGYGLKGMIGNVWEWTSSPSSPWKEEFVLRGGSQSSSPSRYVRRVNRSCSHPDYRIDRVGFRPVLVPVLSERE